MTVGCTKCGGAGFLYEKSLLDGGQYCECTLLQLKLTNMERIWKSMSSSKITSTMDKSPPLLPYVHQNLHITAKPHIFRSHLKAVCLHRSTIWDARVRTDADLLDSWLGTTKLQGNHIYDVEIADPTSLKAVDLPSLVGGFPLVAIVLGVKRLPNRESANSLLEAINYRQHEDLPTWIVDQIDNPITEISHQFYSDLLADRLSEWVHVHLEAEKIIVEQKATTSVEAVLGSILHEEEEVPIRAKPKKPEPIEESDLEIPGLRLTPKTKKKVSRRL